MKKQPDWETVANVLVLALLFTALIIYSTYLEGRVVALEAKVSDLEYSYDKQLTKIDQKVTRLLKAAGVWR